MNQEQLMKVKIKYLEDRLTTMEKSLSRINNILGRFQMTENQGFKDIGDDNGNIAIITDERDKESKDPFIKVMEQGEKDNRHKDIDIYESVGGGFDFDDEPKSKDNDNELI